MPTKVCIVGNKIEAYREDVRFRLMRLLENDPELSQRDMARTLGISLGGVNYCLNALTDMGFVKVANFRASNNKFRYIYVLTPTGILEKSKLTSRFLQRKMQEYEILKSEIDALTQESAKGVSA